ncbi:MAG: hypothetical protein AXA67_07675 [Methylothermaceae bacteria B42]|nr:MAG: hypothetical protein AXA67_07675 [Methylothermaceae bacteria B42]HHJ40097.1 CBS domain-containing protein [Methylothermaceae bacterium]
MLISEIMTRRVTAVAMDASVRLVRGIFGDMGFHQIPVVDRKKLVGIIYENDLLHVISPYVDTPSETERDRETLKKRAHQIMTREPVTVRPETFVISAAAVLVQEKVSALPVVDKDHKLVGIVSWRDLLRFFLDNLA